MADERDLALARRAVSASAVSGAILRHRKCLARIENLDQRTIELLRQGRKLHRRRDGRDHPIRHQANHERHDTRQIRVATAEITGPVKIRLKEHDGLGVARISHKIGIRRIEASRLPLRDAVQRRGTRGRCAFFFVEPARMLELANQQGLSG